MKMNKIRRKQLIERNDGKKGKSQNKLVNNFKVMQQYVSEILIQNGIRYFKRKT